MATDSQDLQVVLPDEDRAESADHPPQDITELRPHLDYVHLQRGVSLLVGASILLVLLLATVIVASAGAPGVALKILLPIDLLLTGVIVWVVLQWPRLVRRNYRSRIGPTGVQAQRGLWWLTTRFIPRGRIQHASVLQGPVERQLGLATVAVHTAGSRASKTRLPGLRHDEALAWVRELTQFQHSGSSKAAEPQAQEQAASAADPEPDSDPTPEPSEPSEPFEPPPPPEVPAASDAPEEPAKPSAKSTPSDTGVDS